MSKFQIPNFIKNCFLWIWNQFIKILNLIKNCFLWVWSQVIEILNSIKEYYCQEWNKLTFHFRQFWFYIKFRKPLGLDLDNSYHGVLYSINQYKRSFRLKDDFFLNVDKVYFNEEALLNTDKAEILFSGPQDSRDSTDKEDILKSRILSFISEAMESLLEEGWLAFFINKSNSGDFILKKIYYSQIDLKNMIIDLEIEKLSFSFDDLFVLRMPIWFEKHKGLRGILSFFKKEQERSSLIPNLIGLSVNNNNYFDLGREKEKTKIRNYSITEGLPFFYMRINTYDDITEFSYLYRFLNGKIEKLKLKDYVLDKINSDLIPKLKKKDLDLGQIKIEGFTSITDIENIKSDLISGNISFEEISKKNNP